MPQGRPARPAASQAHRPSPLPILAQCAQCGGGTNQAHAHHNTVRSLVRALLGPLLLDVKCPADQGSGAVGHGETKILPLPLKMRLVVVVNELALHSVVAACEHACTSHTARSDERQREYETVQTRGSLLQWCLCCLHIRLGSIAPQHVVGAVHCMPCAH